MKKVEKNIVARVHVLYAAIETLLQCISPEGKQMICDKTQNELDLLYCSEKGLEAAKELCCNKEIAASLPFEAMIDVLPKVRIECSATSKDVYINGVYLDPSLSQRYRNHSPDGFNWGYLGSGCAQLALAILMEFTPVSFALNYYQIFKILFVASLDQNKDVDVEINLAELVRECVTEQNGEI